MINNINFKNINPNYYPYAAIVLLLIVCCLSISQCNQNARDATSNKGLYDFEHSRVDSFINKKGLQVADTKVAETYRPEDIKKLSAEVFDLKNSLERKIKQVDLLVRANQKVSVKDTSVITYVPQERNPIDTMVSINKCVLPPRKFTTENKNYSIAGTVLLQGVKIDSIELYNTVSFRVAEKKEGLFSSKKTVVQVVNSNPYFNTESMQSLVLKPKPNNWNKWIKPVAAAALSLIIKNQF
jgi:hypothetical protein